jgi:uroporphyrinogen decarboxylase
MRFLQACERKKTDATPVWFMRQAGRYMAEYRRLKAKYTILELCDQPELAAEVTLQPIRAFDVDAAILFADILLIVRPMGLKLKFVKGEGPDIDPPVRTARDVNRLRRFHPEDTKGKGMGEVLEAVRIIRRELEGRVPLIGFAGAPFTVASYMIEGGPSKDYRNTKAMMHGAPKLWHKLMKLLSDNTADYLKAQVDAGAQAIQLFDSWVGALSQTDFEKYVKPYSARILKAVQRKKVPVIHFGTGTTPFLKSFANTGGDVVGVDWRPPLDEARKIIPASQAIQGNLDPVHLLLPRPTLKPLVRDVVRRAKGKPGHIFNLGHGIIKETDPDTVKAVADWVHDWTS